MFQWVKIIKYEVHAYIVGNLFNVKSSWQSTSQQGLQDAGSQKKESRSMQKKVAIQPGD